MSNGITSIPYWDIVVHNWDMDSKRCGQRWRISWQANWSLRPHMVRRRTFSMRKFGERKARTLAILARRIGVQTMRD
jgi:hypothetical protein